MIQVGSLVCSNCGHDEGRIYIVVKTDGDFAFVVDGIYRLLSNPKKKRFKHLEDLHIDAKIVDKLNSNTIYDYEIKKIVHDIMHKDCF